MTFPTNTTYNPAMRPIMRPVIHNPHFQSNPKEAEEKKRQKMEKEQLAHQNEDASIWRDTGLRYGGYADEVGEFMGPYLGGFGKFLGYGISGLYVGADMATSLPKKYKNANPQMSRGEKIRKTGAEALDLGIFHLVATLLIPPMIIGKAAQLVENKLTGDETRFGKFVHKNEQIGKFAKKAADEQGWINRKLQPKLHRAGHLIADALEPLSRITSRFDADKLKKIPFYGEFLSELPDELTALRKIGNFSDDKLISLGLQKSIPMAVGISLVPLIAHPFDELMLKVQDWTIRPLLGKNKIITDENGKRKSVKDPAFWGHQKQPVKPMDLPADPVTPANLPEAIQLHRNQTLRTKARFGYYPHMPRLTPNPMYPKPPVYPVMANPFSQPVNQPTFPPAFPLYPQPWPTPAALWPRP